MALFKMKGKPVGLISGRPKTNALKNVDVFGRVLVTGLEKGLTPVARGIYERKGAVSKFLQPKFKPISVKRALELDKPKTKAPKI